MDWKDEFWAYEEAQIRWCYVRVPVRRRVIDAAGIRQRAGTERWATANGQRRRRRRVALKATLLRIKPNDGQRLNELAERVPWAGKHQLALEAARLGLPEPEQNPTRPITKGG